MSTSRRTRREVLRDKAGLSTSIIETLGGISLKTLIIVMVGGLLSTLMVFWAMAATSADASAGYQTASLKFEKSVKAADVVVGIDAKRVGLLTDMPGGKCQVETWQSGTRDGGKTLQVDTKSVTGICTPTTALTAVGAGEVGQELLFGIEAPVFTYENLGGREITFDASGIPTGVEGTRPTDVKLADWDDVRPYKVVLNLVNLDEDTADVTKKAEMSAYTNVVNVTIAEDDLRFVPAPNTDPIPGPLRITGVERSSTTGTDYVGAREGIAVSFSGAVCPSGPTKVNLSYTQQGPSAKPAVNTVFSAALTGAATTIHLGSVANGASGAVEMAATCIDGGVAEKASIGYTQPVPATVLTVKQNAAPEKHDLSWVPVSSLPTSFELRWTVGSKNNALLTTTSALKYTSVNTVGANLGLKTDYTIVATIDSNKSPSATANITNPLPQPAATVVDSNATGASWPAVACVNSSTPQYATRYYQQAGTSAAVNWTPLSSWSTARSVSGITTPGYGRTVLQVHTRCIANVSGVVSPANNSYNVFYAPEAIDVAAGRSAVAGTEYMGAREGMIAWHSGARCYNNSSSRITLTWDPISPSGQSNVSSTRTIVPTGGGQSVDLANVRNGAKGNLVGTVTCTAGESSSSTKSKAYTQTIPNPGLSISQSSANSHKLTWNRVSSLPTAFAVEWGSSNGLIGGTVANTSALTYTATQAAGSTYGQTSYYTVRPTVNGVSSATSNNTHTSWPAPPTAKGIAFTNGSGQTGTLRWSHTAACPTGTQTQSREIQNVKWNSTTGVSIWGNHDVGSWAVKTSSAWSHSYALQGHPYQNKVETRCYSPATGSVSSSSSAQSGTFYTDMVAPAAPKYNGFDYRDRVRGDTTGYETCWNLRPNNCIYTHPNPSGWYQSVTFDYTSSCPAGSKLGWSYYDRIGYVGDHSTTGYFGRADGYQFGDGVRGHWIQYNDPVYQCDTLWKKSPTSAKGADIRYYYDRIWGAGA